MANETQELLWSDERIADWSRIAILGFKTNVQRQDAMVKSMTQMRDEYEAYCAHLRRQEANKQEGGSGG